MSFYDDVMRMERMRTGNYGADCAEYIPPRCPICKSRNWDFVYKNYAGEVIGCDCCVKEDYDWDGD